VNVTAVKDIPNVDQTSIWKGYYEAHFMSGKEINVKYPILNKKWKYSPHKLRDNYDGYYYVNLNDLVPISSDPWYREFKDYVPIEVDGGTSKITSKMYHTTVEGNSVLLAVYKKNN
jgi:hypothetical protein